MQALVTDSIIGRFGVLLSFNKVFNVCVSGIMYQCILCAAGFSSVGKYTSHFIANHRIYGRMRECAGCCRHFQSRAILAEHVKERVCLGRPLAYSSCSGTLYYLSGLHKGMVLRSLYPRMENDANALLGYRAPFTYMLRYRAGEVVREWRKEYAIKLPGVSERDFAPFVVPSLSRLEVLMLPNDVSNEEELLDAVRRRNQIDKQI